MNPASVAQPAARHKWSHALMSLAPGIVLALGLALFAAQLADLAGAALLRVQGVDPTGKASPVSGVAMAVVLGLLIANTVGTRALFTPGLQFAVKKLLRVGIILVGIKLSIVDVLRVGGAGIPVVLAIVAFGLGATLLLARIAGVSRRLGSLAAASTAICGITATMAVAPAIEASDEEVAYTIANVTLFGLVAMVFYPYLAHALFADQPASAGLFLGTAIHDTSQVMGAALSYQEVFGSERAAQVATVAKLTRNALLIVVVPFLALLHRRSGSGSEPSNPKKKISLVGLFPLFVVGFIALSILRTVGDAGAAGDGLAFGLIDPGSWQALVRFGGDKASGLFLAMALAGVGLTTKLSVFKGLGLKPLAIGLSAALLVGGASLLLATLVAKEPRQITVLFVADLHGQLEEHPEFFWNGGRERTVIAGGFARLATAIAGIRAERGGDVILIDGGDTFHGSGPAAMTEGAAVAKPLDALGFDVGVPGNWEVVYGPEVLRKLSAGLQHPLIAANLRDEASGERLFRPYIVREIAGVRVAVLGYTDPDVPLRQPPAYSRGLRYDGPEELQVMVRELREREKADVVLLASHIGLSKAVALSGELEGVDVHLSADTHERTYEPIEKNGSWVVEPGAFGSFLGRLDLWVEDGKIVRRSWELIELDAARFAQDERVAALVDETVAPFRSELAKPIGSTTSELVRYAVVETPLDNVLADALRATTGTEIALSNGFRFGTPVPPGPIREKDLWNFYPVVTNLKTGKVKGSQLRAFWERELENVFARDASKRFGGWLPRPSGLEIEFVVDAPAGQRIRKILAGGKPLEDERLYTITACDREGDAPDMVCRIPGAQEVSIWEIDAHEAVRRQLARGPVHGAIEGRVTAIDHPAVLRSQL